MKRFSKLGAAALLLAVAACGGGDKQIKAPRSNGNLAPAIAAAFKEEAVGDQQKAIDLYLRTLEAAGGAPDDPASPGVAMAALDALVHGDVLAFGDIAQTSALVDRVKGASIDERLAKIEKNADGPFVPGLIATARLALAERRGDAKAATDHRARTGCAREATVGAPLAWMPVSGAREPGLLDRPGPLPAEVPGPGPFMPKVKLAHVNGLGCRIPLYAETTVNGVREVVVDVDVPEAGVIGLGLRSSSSSVVRAGGQIAIERPHALGPRSATRLARVETTAGKLRVVARVGMEQDFGYVELDAWDANGKPLPMHAPKPGEAATATVKRTLPSLLPDPKSDPERLAVALSLLASGDMRGAENLLHPQIARNDVPAELLLVYARAVRYARDLPIVKAQERARAAYDRALTSWPSSWEAIVEHAVLAGARRGHAEANLEALADIDKLRAKNPSSAPALLDAFEAMTAGREHLYDRARTAFDRAKPQMDGTSLLYDIERLAFERTGKDLVAFDCTDGAARNRGSLTCHNAKVSVGDRNGAEKELERLRALAGSPQVYLSYSSRSAIEQGDLVRAGKILDAMNPADRPLSSTFAVKGKAAVPELLRMATIARDGPSALPSLLRAAGDDPLAKFEGIAEKVVNDATAGALMANAATAVLAHEEHYDVEPSGLLHFVLLDVRRVMGTTDVESNAQAGAPQLMGRDTLRALRRRIFKKDGRIVLPDRTPHAAQSHADLSQLEAGDAVEAIYEGWGIPGETGNIGIDTPDLLPERTSLREATIELRLPQGLKHSMWSHPLLGKPEEKTDQGKRVLTWKVKDRPVRRLEGGVPKMDRGVLVSFSTTTWDDVARGLRDTVVALDADSPEVSIWAREAGGGKPPSVALVESVVAASGQAVKEASGVLLTDIDLGRASGGGFTARSMLATHEGSRTWLIVRALRELGVKVDIVVAENEPFSDSPTFPPHFGRFMHPLAVAHVPDPAKPGALTDVWIDADVPGPPLPAGRISPELRGRTAIWHDGKIGQLPAVAGGLERDEIDIRLAVDDQGNAKGTITVLLRGRSAQDLAEALVHLVGLERQRALRGIALGWVPFATVEKVELSSTEGSWQVAIRADLSAPAYAQVEGTKPGSRTWILPGMDPVHYVFPRPYVTTLAATYASHGARESALAINHATQFHVRRRVDLPPKAQIARLPGPFDGKGPLLSASRKISVNGSSIEEDFTLDVTTGTVPKDTYDVFVAETHKTDDAFRASTRVKPPTP